MLENTNNSNNEDSNQNSPDRADFRADNKSSYDHARSLARTAKRKAKKDPMAPDVAEYALAAAELFAANSLSLDELDALWIATDSYFYQKKFNEVLEVCKRGLDVADQNYSTKYQAVMSYNYAWAYIQLEDYESAKPYMAIAASKYEELADLPAWGRAVSFQAKLLVESRDYEQAIDYFDQALDILAKTICMSDVVECYSYKIDSLIKLDNTARAQELAKQLEHAISHSVDPTMDSLPFSQLVMARLAIASQSYDEAEQRLFALKAKVQAENRPDWQLKINLEIARLQKAQGYYPEAVQLLGSVLGASKMIKNDVDPLEIYVELITAYLGCENYIEASQATQDAIELATNLNRQSLAEFFKLQQAIQYLDQGLASTSLGILQAIDTQYWSSSDENMREYLQAKTKAYQIERPEEQLLGS